MKHSKQLIYISVLLNNNNKGEEENEREDEEWNSEKAGECREQQSHVYE
jgi:hypothetical protein